MKPESYAAAGVDVERGDRFARFISQFPSSAVSRGIGGFAGGIPFPSGQYRNPVLLGATDGVGTKLLVAKQLDDYTTVGVDLVAMCVNDLAVCGADPLFFLDYIACGRIDEERLRAVIAGVVKGCEIAGCALVGGETAEMPDMYEPDDLDLAGFSVGAVDRDRQLPMRESIKPGDSVLGLPSSGIHSNGFSLARKALDGADQSVWSELLLPTRIYVDELRQARGRILGAAHITGGGLAGNLARLLPRGTGLSLSWDWAIPDVFDRIQTAGSIALAEMRAVFNMGIGLAVIVAREDHERVAELLGDDARRIGEVVDG